MKISVFTCTYNRLGTLRRTFEALLRQTFDDFEWVLVDNGSTDGTLDVVDTWLIEATFPVTIHRIETNSGYQNAYNAGVQICKGEFFVNLDSDDECVPNSLGRFIEIWNTIPAEQRSRFVGVSVNCKDQHGVLIGVRFPYDPFDSNSLEKELRYKVKGEKWGILRLDVLRDYPFPTSQYHVNPSIVWRAISRNFQTRYTNDVLRIKHNNEGDRADQVTLHLSAVEKAYGKWINSRALLNEHIDCFSQAPLIFLLNAMNYSRCAYLLGHSFLWQLSDIKSISGKTLVALSMPYGKLWAVFVKKNRLVKQY